MADAASMLLKRGLQFTMIRRAVLGLLYREQRAIGAYDLAAIHERESGRRTAAYAIYRALDFLQEQGLVAHLESTHTYVACTPGRSSEASVFFVCTQCGMTTERLDSSIERMIRVAADAIGFRARARAIDVEGLCRHCSTAP